MQDPSDTLNLGPTLTEEGPYIARREGTTVESASEVCETAVCQRINAVLGLVVFLRGQRFSDMVVLFPSRLMQPCPSSLQATLEDPLGSLHSSSIDTLLAQHARASGSSHRQHAERVNAPSLESVAPAGATRPSPLRLGSLARPWAAQQRGSASTSDAGASTSRPVSQTAAGVGQGGRSVPAGRNMWRQDQQQQQQQQQQHVLTGRSPRADDISAGNEDAPRWLPPGSADLPSSMVSVDMGVGCRRAC
jgi:hypothetical protein